MELTVKQAVYALLSASLIKGLPLHRYGTVKMIREGLDKVYGVKISRQRIYILLREISEECCLLEYTGEEKAFLPVYVPRERVYKLGEPGKILTVRKWKRHGPRRQESNRSPEDKANAS